MTAQPRLHSPGRLPESVLTALITAVSLLGARESNGSPCRHVSDLPSLLSQEGILLDPQSRVSVRKTTQELLVHMVKGKILLNISKMTGSHVIVTAGHPRISDADALVCMNVDSDRTFVTVLGWTRSRGNPGPWRQFSHHQGTNTARQRPCGHPPQRFGPHLPPPNGALRYLIPAGYVRRRIGP